MQAGPRVRLTQDRGHRVLGGRVQRCGCRENQSAAGQGRGAIMQYPPSFLPAPFRASRSSFTVKGEDSRNCKGSTQQPSLEMTLHGVPVALKNKSKIPRNRGLSPRQAAPRDHICEALAEAGGQSGFYKTCQMLSIPSGVFASPQMWDFLQCRTALCNSAQCLLLVLEQHLNAC